MGINQGNLAAKKLDRNNIYVYIQVHSGHLKIDQPVIRFTKKSPQQPIILYHIYAYICLFQICLNYFFWNFDFSSFYLIFEFFFIVLCLFLICSNSIEGSKCMYRKLLSTARSISFNVIIKSRIKVDNFIFSVWIAHK